MITLSEGNFGPAGPKTGRAQDRAVWRASVATLMHHLAWRELTDNFLKSAVSKINVY